MASLIYAYSTETKDTIDAEEAYELFWSGIIKNGSAFTCPEQGCKGNVTCVNIDKVEGDMLQHPHFRGYNHSENCPLVNPQSGSASTSTSSTGMGIKSNLDEFFLTRPENVGSTALSNLVEGVSKTGGSTGSKSDKAYRSKYFSIRSLVSKFAKYRKQQKECIRNIQIGKKTITYKNFFVGIYNQKFESFYATDRVYWGVAYLNKEKGNDYYHIKFEQSIEFEGKKVRPSFFLKEKLIESYHSRLIEKRIELYSQQKSPRAIVFLYGTPEAIEKDGQLYINFEIENSDMLDIRGLDFFEKLRKEK